MDGDFDLSSLLSSPGSSDAISNAMSILMKKPELVEMIASELGLANGENSTKNEQLIGGDKRMQDSEKPVKHEKNSNRERLLLALKPYLNEKRQGAIDIMISLGSLGGLVGSIDPNMLKTLLGGNNV